ncbi:ATP-binding protein [Agrobacterium vitis]|uniref:ATP-binding protein n=1 Tax=Allorhizobium ampelinum TaxID=3025782 RepID=UPI001F2D74C3|nr:ATP-binding protein [Allorhizobium ampelinum]MCF1464050.1 ATP-binding protein [Allorhizobium ampelinum]
MTSIAQALANYVESQVDAAARSTGGNAEIRLVFHGPPLEILSNVFELLVAGKVAPGVGKPPYLLQVPRGELPAENPGVGESGWCDETHLLDLRNLPGQPSFVALVPPGQHSILSVSSTTIKFGVDEATNGANAQFEDWWDDAFVQRLVTEGLSIAGVQEGQLEEGRLLVETAARAADELEHAGEVRRGVWRVLSRLFEIPAALTSQPGIGLSLACGLPPKRNGLISAREQLATLDKIAEAMVEGFRSGIDRLSEGAGEDDRQALEEFLLHVRSRCQVQTTFARATAAYYSPGDGLSVSPPPGWWGHLDVERWAELLAEEPGVSGDILMTCMNSLADLGKATPAVVLDRVELAFATKGGEQSGARVLVERTPAGGAKVVGDVIADAGEVLADNSPPSHKNPISYKASAPGYKPGSMKVVSLATWQPGILVACRASKKLSSPRRTTKAASKGPVGWETTLTLPGPGRYELLVFNSPDVEVERVATGLSDQLDGRSDSIQLPIRPFREMLQLEVEAEGNYQVEFKFRRTLRDGSVSEESCRAFIVCEDAPGFGCRSEFERLIRVNRRQLEAFDARAEIDLNRSARATMLQDWMLSDAMVEKSYQPLILANDYGAHWAPPRWGDGHGPILSAGTFISDPRPSPEEFEPPATFLSTRKEIARRVRGDGDQSGVFETARLGEWISRDADFRAIVEQYVESYNAWLAAAPDVACWCDVIAVCSLDNSGRSLSRVPDAVLLSPFHPLRLGWHAVAQEVLLEADELGKPCPAASVLDPDCVPDIMSMHVRAPSGIERIDFLAAENGTDYWSVLWNGSRLADLPRRSQEAPFGEDFGITVGGISAGFSAAQVGRALDDVSELLAAKPVISVAVSSVGGTTNACNDGLLEWCKARYEEEARRPRSRATGPRFVEVYDERPEAARPDDARIANISEDTRNAVRWFSGQPEDSNPDLGIIAQLDMSEPGVAAAEHRSPLGVGALIRHRVRRQMRIYLSESRQSTAPVPSGNILADKVSSLASVMENSPESRLALQFAPNVHEVRHMLFGRKTDFVAVSSSAIDPACFLGEWLEGAYLWDYELPSYSHRSGDTNGYYLLSQVSDADRESLEKALARLPGCERIEGSKINEVLLEVARRGIPTIKGLAGDDAGATGDLGVLVGARLLQDRFRRDASPAGGILPILGGTASSPTVSLVIPVDPFRNYLADLSRALGKELKDTGLLRPDLVVVGIDFVGSAPRIKITPVEIKCRPTASFGQGDASDALAQAKAFSSLLSALAPHEGQPTLWALAFQHLLLSIIGFGLRVYSQQEEVADHTARWPELHESIAKAILDGAGTVEIDRRGRLIVVDDSHVSAPRDNDKDGFDETIVIGREDAGKIVAGDPAMFYEMVRSRLGNWDFLPRLADSPVDETAAGGGQVQDGPGIGAVPAFVAEPVEAMSEHSAPRADIAQEGTPPQSATGLVVDVGATVDGFSSRQLSLNVSDTRLNQLNMGVVGDLGTGKTQLLKSIITQINDGEEANRGIRPRFLIFDYKNDYSSKDFVAATGAKVVRPHRLPLNLFDTRTIGDVSTPWFDRFRFFADVLAKIYPGIGPVQRDKLKRAVRESYERAPAGSPPTLRDVHAAYSDILDGKSDSPMAIIDDLIDMEIFEADEARTVPFDTFLDGVVVVSLSALGQDDHSKNMLVAVMLNMFYENMLRTPKRPFLGTDPQLRAIDSYLLVDEADNIMRYEFDVLRKLLLQGREFGTGVILASQYLRHFKAGATDYREPLLTWFIHKVPNVTAAELSALGLTANAGEVAERVKTLANHRCLYKSFDVQGEIIRGYPFFELMKAREEGTP